MTSTPTTISAGTVATNAAQRTATLTATGFLVLRLAVGFVFAMHGWQKLTMMGIPGVAGFFGAVGVPFPELMAFVVTAVELVGGIALILGIGTRIVGVLLAADMVGALLLVHLPNGFFADQGGYEFVLTLLGVAVFFALAGAGKWSLDAVLWGRKHSEGAR